MVNNLDLAKDDYSTKSCGIKEENNYSRVIGGNVLEQTNRLKFKIANDIVFFFNIYQHYLSPPFWLHNPTSRGQEKCMVEKMMIFYLPSSCNYCIKTSQDTF